MRLKRRGLLEGYIKVPELSKSGKQHLHVLFRGSYIEQALISRWWQELHHAKIVDIRKVKVAGNRKRIASYMAKYMSKENIYRYSWNWPWVWRGFVGDWKKLKRLWRYLNDHGMNIAYSDLLIVWRGWLQGRLVPDFSLLPEPL